MTPADLRAAIAELHGSVVAASRAWNVPRNTLNNWLRGQRRVPGWIETLVRYDRERREQSK